MHLIYNVLHVMWIRRKSLTGNCCLFDCCCLERERMCSILGLNKRLLILWLNRTVSRVWLDLTRQVYCSSTLCCSSDKPRWSCNYFSVWSSWRCGRMRWTKETIVLLCSFTGGLLTSACDILSVHRGSWLLSEIMSVQILTADITKDSN